MRIDEQLAAEAGTTFGLRARFWSGIILTIGEL
jgi:hypothetical protein